ncbi:hypothetical protein [Mycobacterium avium]|uniref:hypothetical protein n=1 Tax=Mycobacterium avium TaxID=1764 RepID=UPI0002ECF5D0|nr:hypothetical protein [Mycobacterium avium]
MNAPVPDEDRQQRIDDAVRRIHVMNDQLEIFHAVRRIVTEPTALSTYPAATVRQIRDLYRAFDAKRPAAQADDK